MYDEVMQLIALAKNDEQYFKRIDALKQEQLKLAHVLEIAKTLEEANMHMAKSRQDAAQILEDAQEEAKAIKASAATFLDESRQVVVKNKELQKEIKEKLEELRKKMEATASTEKKMLDSIEEHHKLSVARAEEQDIARKLKNEFETKLKKMREIAAS